MLKKIQAWFLAGVMMAITLGIPAFILKEVWDLVVWISQAIGWQLFVNPNLNSAVYLVILMVFLCVIGWIFKFRFFRMCFDWFTAKVPGLSTIAKFIPRNEELEILSSGALKEAMVQLYPGVWAVGLVTKPNLKRFGRDFIRIVSLHSPLPFTGALLEIDVSNKEVVYTGSELEVDLDKCKVFYTGEGVEEYFAMVISLGARSGYELKAEKKKQ